MTTMTTTRRKFVELVGAAAAAVSAGSSTDVIAGSQAPKPAGRIAALAFDAYGTLFDPFSVAALCEELFPGQGSTLAQLWRAKQLQYTLLRTVMGRHKDFSGVTEEALIYAGKSLRLELSPDRRRRLMEAYLTLTPFPDVRRGLEALRRSGVRLAILSNGEPKMLAAAARNAGIADLLHAIISAEEAQAFKPSPRMYSLISHRLEADRGTVGFVSAHSWDVSGAAAAGLRTFWIQRSGAELQEELGLPATHIVRAITDLPGLVSRPPAGRED
jgi:2-haloacid dehalogenase